MNSDKELMPGDRVFVFDHRLFKDDSSTPLSMTMKPATIIRRYGERKSGIIYEDLVDVLFDHRSGIESKAHFTWSFDLIEHGETIYQKKENK
jgi:hypothetical protein